MTDQPGSSSDPVDPYLDPHTGILTNLVGARTQAELDRAESDWSTARTIELAARPIAGRFDLDHLRAIHRHLFSDVYPFAGQIRTVNIYKRNDPSSGFFPVERFATGAEFVFGQLAADNHLRGRTPDRFVAGLATHFDAINHLHPFREGNGRTQRIFVDQLAAQAGYRIDWTRVTAQQNIDASRGGVGALRELFAATVTPVAAETIRQSNERSAGRAAIRSSVESILKSVATDPRGSGYGSYRAGPGRAPEALPNREHDAGRGDGYEAGPQL